MKGQIRLRMCEALSSAVKDAIASSKLAAWIIYDGRLFGGFRMCRMHTQTQRRRLYLGPNSAADAVWFDNLKSASIPPTVGGYFWDFKFWREKNPSPLIPTKCKGRYLLRVKQHVGYPALCFIWMDDPSSCDFILVFVGSSSQVLIHVVFPTSMLSLPLKCP